MENLESRCKFASLNNKQKQNKMKKETQRIIDMLDSWEKKGVAYSNIKNNDDKFIEKCGYTYLQIVVTSKTGLDIIYSKPK